MLCALVMCGLTLPWGLPGAESWAPDELTPKVLLSTVGARFSNGWNHLYPPAGFYAMALGCSPVLAYAQWGLFELQWPSVYFVLFVLMRVVVVAMATATVALVGLSAHELGLGRRGAIMAMLVVVGMPVFVFDGAMANVDVPYLMWYAAALLAYATIVRRGFSTARAVALCGDPTPRSRISTSSTR